MYMNTCAGWMLKWRGENIEQNISGKILVLNDDTLAKTRNVL